MGNPLDVLYEAVGWVLSRIYGVLSPVLGPSSGWTWALTIVILVVLMRLVMVPLFIKQMHTTRAMTSLQPQMAALRKRYKNDKQTLNAETMKLYQEAGVNPLMGCLPVVAQLPLFFSLFSVLKAIAEYKGGTPKYGLALAMVQSARHAKILGVNIADKVLFTHGLAVPFHAKAVIFCTVVVSMVTTYLTVRQSQKRGMMPVATPDNPMGQSQKYMAYIMPFFALTGLYWPFGLVLYWVTTNLWTLIQQFVLFQRYPYTPPSAAGAGGATVVTTAPALGPKGTSAMRRAAAPRSAAKDGGKPGQNGSAPAGSAPSGSAPAGTAPSGSAPSGSSPNGSGSSAGSAGAAAKAANGSAPAARKAASNGGAAPAKAASARTASAKAPSAMTPVKAAGTKAPAAKAPAAKPPAKPPAKAPVNRAAGSAARASGAKGTGTPASGAGGAGGASGMLRKLGRGRSEPEPQVDEAEVKLVRQQRQRQSRSKRSGKR